MVEWFETPFREPPMMNRMPDPIERTINLVLDRLQDLEPTEYDLGTPQLEIVEDIDKIIALGRRALPYLLVQAERRQAKAVAYIVLILGKIGIVEAIEPVRAIRAQYQALDNKDPWDYAVIGQANVALALLDNASL
jgi:hypothetical protein